MSYTTSDVNVGEDSQFGDWSAYILLFPSPPRWNDAVAGRGETRQEAIAELIQEVLNLEQKHRAANEALVRFLGEDAT